MARHVARLSSNPCGQVELVLIAARQLAGKPSTLHALYLGGGSWSIPEPDERFVIVVSAQPTGPAGWRLCIEVGPPILPRVVYRAPPSEARLRALAGSCHALASALHARLRPVFPELRWELETDTGDVAWVDAPVPPRT